MSRKRGKGESPGLHDPGSNTERTDTRPAVEETAEPPTPEANGDGDPNAGAGDPSGVGPRPKFASDSSRPLRIDARVRPEAISEMDGVSPEVERLLRDRPVRRLPPERQIYVNRNLRMDRIEVIGFDMDYTLAVYAGRKIETLAYEMTLRSLIKNFGRPQFFEELAYEPELVIRGLVVDKVLGNLLKMDAHGHVARVFHGLRKLSKKERVEHYRRQKIHFGGDRYEWIDTLFALPEAALYTQAVEGYEKRGEAFDPASLYQDIRAAIDGVHRDGSLKAIILKDLPHYVEKDPELGPTLHRLRSSGKRLFVLTNSYWDYTDAVMHHLLDGALPEYPGWRSYFDLVVVGASKPAFFGDERPFYEVVEGKVGADGETETRETPADSLERGKAYQGGNLKDFEAWSGWGGETVLYVGDHIYGDMLRTKRSGLWRTAMIVKELERELLLLESRRGRWQSLHRLDALRARLDDAIASQKEQVNALTSKRDQTPEFQTSYKRSKQELDALRREQHRVLSRLADLATELWVEANARWGFLFKDGNENSRFGEQVQDYACVYTGRVTNFGAYSPTYYFRAPWESLPHEPGPSGRWRF